MSDGREWSADHALLIGVVVASLLAVATPAHAQKAAQAEALFKDGVALLKAGKIHDACEAFSASQRLDAANSTLMKLADCREREGRLATAWELFLQVERQTRGDGRYGAMGTVARDRAVALEARLSYLTINVADEVRIDGLEVALDETVIDAGAWNRALPIDGGAHVITGRAPGHEAWSTTVSVGAERDKKAVEVPRFKALRASGPVAAVAPTGDGDGDALEPAAEDGDRPRGLGRRRVIALSAVGTGVAAVGLGVVFALQGQDLDQQADAICPGNVCDPGDERAVQLTDRARTKLLVADVAFAAGAVAIGAGAVLWFTARRRGGAAAVSFAPHVSSQQVSLSFHGAF